MANNNNFEFIGQNLKKGHLAVVSELQLKPFTYANLPTSPVAASVAYITDSNTAVIGAAIAGGGVNKVLGVYGTVWTVLGVLT